MTDTAQTWRGALGRAKALEFQEYALAIVVVLLFVAGAILKPDTFPTWDNIRNMLTQSSVVGVLAIGMTFVIATAGIDLSVGSIVSAAGLFGGIIVGTDGTSSLIFIVSAISSMVIPPKNHNSTTCAFRAPMAFRRVNASSKATMVRSGTRPMNRSTSSAVTIVAVGLFGLATNTSLVVGVTARAIASRSRR